MKITIWQQFSSNHSAHFTIVGVFENLEQAENARQFIKGFFKERDDWYQANPEQLEKLSGASDKFKQL